jgi:hypothetical protein
VSKGTATRWTLGLWLAALLWGQSAMAGINAWTTTGPNGLNVTAVVADLSSPGTVYAGTDYGVFKSADGGNSWNPENSGLPSLEVRWLALDPAQTNTLYVGVGSGYGVPFMSTDGGESWIPWSAHPANYWVTFLSFSPGDPEMVYASGFGEFLKSTDGGVHWVVSDDGLPRSTTARSLAIDPLNSQTLYLGTTAYGVFKSTNKGDHWIAINDGFPVSQSANALAVDPQDSETVYAGANAVWKSTDGGAHWTAAGNGLPQTTNMVGALVIDPIRTDNIYAATWFGVFRSKNGGGHWTPMSSCNVTALATDGQSPLTIYEGCSNGMIYSFTECASETLYPDSLPEGVVGVAYHQVVTAAGGTAPYSFAMANGALPAGLNLASDGTILGAPTAPGNFTFTLVSTDQNGCNGRRDYALKIDAAPPVISNIKKSAGTFQLVVLGSNFHARTSAVIGGIPWTNVATKSPGKVVIKGGAELRAMLPKRVAVPIAIKNEDDGGISAPYSFMR